MMATNAYAVQGEYAMKASAEQPKRDSEIFTEMTRLSKSIEHLTESFGRLGVVLTPVTRPEPVCSKEGTLATQPPQTQLGLHIRSMKDQIDELNMRVAQQIDLTEL